MSIIVKNTIKIYGKQKALDDVSFEINSGEIVAFLGPNGAGKSTMMKIISCFIPQTAGKVLVNGFDVSTQSLDVRRQIGYLPEHNPLYMNMFVKEFLNFSAGLYKVKNRKARIAEMIKRTGLQHEQHKKIAALSKGYRQRVGLAKALIHNPQVLILDEPTTGLDPNQIVEIRNLIAEIAKEKTIMLSTHIMQEVEAISNRVIIINKGKIVADEATDKVKLSSEKQYQTVLVEFSASVNETQLQAIEGVLQVLHAKDDNWLIQSEINNDIRSNIFNFAVANQLAVLSMQKKEKSMEEVFQELTV